jgi:hypothetical protein
MTIVGAFSIVAGIIVACIVASAALERESRRKRPAARAIEMQGPTVESGRSSASLGATPGVVRART